MRHKAREKEFYCRSTNHKGIGKEYKIGKNLRTRSADGGGRLWGFAYLVVKDRRLGIKKRRSSIGAGRTGKVRS